MNLKNIVLAIVLLFAALPFQVSAQIQKTESIGTVNSQTGTSYTFVFSDRGKLVTFNNGSAVAATLPQATAGGSFRSGWTTFAYNLGAGTVTITPTTSTINGAASIALATGEGASIFSNGSNYLALRTTVATAGSGGIGTVTTTGAPANGNLTKFSGASSITNGDLSGDITTSGSLVTTLNTNANTESSRHFCADAGANDAYACSLSPSIASYQDGAQYTFRANTANTGAATLSLNSVGAKTIKKVSGGITTDLSDNDIRANQNVTVVYYQSGDVFQMQSTLGNAASGGGTNPTSDVIPYNNAGTFADSPLTRVDASTVRAEVYYGAGASDINTNGVISGRGQGVIVGRDLQLGLQNGSGTLDALLSKPNTRHSGLLSVRRDTSGNGATFAYPPDSPAQITANQNDYSLGTNRSKYIRLTSNGVWDVTGLTIPSDGLGNTQVAGQEHVLVNVGANGIILKHQSASSSAANRFLCSTGADITLNANEAADIFYDATTQRWRVFKR